MRPEIADVRRTIEYAQSHEQMRWFLPWALVGILLGLFIMTPLDAEEAERDKALFGGAFVVLSLAFLGVLIYRRKQPNAPCIVLSPQGIMFRDLSEKVIPWDEIREIGVAYVSASRVPVPTRVTEIVVSQRFYQSLAGIAVLLTNQMGFWSTDAQEQHRSKAAEWRAWKEKFEADQKAIDEQLRRTSKK